MALKLRLMGWALFLGGSALILFVGELSMKHPATYVGVFTTLAGMICTSTCNLMASYADLRKRRKAIDKDPVEHLDATSAARAKQVIRERKDKEPSKPES